MLHEAPKRRIVVHRGVYCWVAFLSDRPEEIYKGRSLPEAFGRLVGAHLGEAWELPPVEHAFGGAVWYWPPPMNVAELDEFNALQLSFGRADYSALVEAT